jgi:hypothetical protein
MSESFGISHGGRSAEDLFISLTGAQRAARAALGDAVLEGRHVEVKHASSSTLNQVRAVKYLPLVVYHSPSDTWYVVPAHVVVHEVSQRARGQHTENPFESATINLNRLAAYRLENGSQLRERTLAAIEESDKYPELQQLMNQVLMESKSLAADSIVRVRQLLRQLGIAAV